MPILIRTISVFILTMFAAIFVSAQIDASSTNGKPSIEPLPQSLMESLAKQRIHEEKKEYDALLKKGGDAVELSKELNKSFTKNRKLTSQDQLKLKDLEKLLKKMRSDMGGEGDSDEETDIEQKSQANALSTLLENTEKLFDQIKKTSRHTISAVAISSSNAILSIVKFLRFGK